MSDGLTEILDWFGREIVPLFPGAGTWLGDLLYGQVPLAQASDVYDLADAWGRVTEALAAAYDEAQHAADHILESWEGDGGAQAFAQAWFKYLEALGGIAQSTGGMQGAVQAFGLEVELMKIMVVINLIVLAITIYLMVAASPISLGGSLAGILPAFGVAKTAISAAATKVIQSIGSITMRTLLRSLLEFATHTLPTLFRTQLPTLIRTQVPNVVRNQLPNLVRSQIPNLGKNAFNTVFRTQLPNLARNMLPKNVIARSVGDKLASKWVKSLVTKEMLQGVKNLAGKEARLLLLRGLAQNRQLLAKEIEQQLLRKFAGKAGTELAEHTLSRSVQRLTADQLTQQLSKKAISDFAAKEIAEMTFKRELGKYLGVRMAFGAGLMGGGNLLGQFVQILEGHRDSIDVQQVLIQATTGAAFGAGMWGGIPGHIVGGGLAGAAVGAGGEYLHSVQTNQEFRWGEVRHSAFEGARAGGVFGVQNHIQTMHTPGRERIGQEYVAFRNERGGLSSAALDLNAKLGIELNNTRAQFARYDNVGPTEVGWVDRTGYGERVQIPRASTEVTFGRPVPSHPTVPIGQIDPVRQIGPPSGPDGGGPRQLAAPPGDRSPGTHGADPARSDHTPARGDHSPSVIEGRVISREPVAPPPDPVRTGDTTGPHDGPQRIDGAARTAEPRTAEPRTVEPRTAEPRTVEPRTVEPRTVEPRTAEPRTVEPRTVEPRTVEPRHGESTAPHEPPRDPWHGPAPDSPAHEPPHDGEPRLRTGGGFEGQDRSPESIEWGTVRYREHPDFETRILPQLEARDFSIVDTTRSPRVNIKHIYDSNERLIAIEHELHAQPRMRFLDLEHELGHIAQIFDRGRFPDGPPATEVWRQHPDGSRTYLKTDPRQLHAWQDSIVEYHVRLQEYIRLAERGVGRDVLTEHADRLDSGHEVYEKKGLRDGRSKSQAAWARQHFPDIPELEQRARELRNDPPPVRHHPSTEPPADGPLAKHDWTPEPQDGRDMFSGGSIRPEEYGRAQEWAADAYERFLADPADVPEIVENVRHVERADGRIGFEADEVASVKKHLMDDKHVLDDYEGGTVLRRFDPDPDIAEAWIRLREGRALPEDITLLEHELVELNYERSNPGASYRDAHVVANRYHNWELVAPERTGENLDNSWGRNPSRGDTHRLPEDPGRQSGGGVRVRLPRGGDPPPGDHEGFTGGDSVGRESGRPVRTGPVQDRPVLPESGPVAGPGVIRGVDHPSAPHGPVRSGGKLHDPDDGITWEFVPVEPTRIPDPVALPDEVAAALNDHVAELVANRTPGAAHLPYRAAWHLQWNIAVVQYPDGTTVAVSLQVNTQLPPGHPVIVSPAMTAVDGAWVQTTVAVVGVPPHLPAEVAMRPDTIGHELTHAWQTLHDHMRSLPKPPTPPPPPVQPDTRQQDPQGTEPIQDGRTDTPARTDPAAPPPPDEPTTHPRPVEPVDAGPPAQRLPADTTPPEREPTPPRADEMRDLRRAEPDAPEVRADRVGLTDATTPDGGPPRPPTPDSVRTDTGPASKLLHEVVNWVNEHLTTRADDGSVGPKPPEQIHEVLEGARREAQEIVEGRTSAPPFGFDRFFNDPRWMESAAAFERRVGAHFFRDPATVDAARDALTRLRESLISLARDANRDASEAEIIKQVDEALFNEREDANTSEGQVGRGVPFEDLIARGNLRELMTAFFNGAYANYHEQGTLANRLMDIVNNGRWNDVRNARLNEGEIGAVAKMLDSTWNRLLASETAKNIYHELGNFRRDTMSMGNVIIRTPHGIRALIDVLVSRHERTTRAPGEAESLGLVTTPEEYARRGAPLGEFERRRVEQIIGGPLRPDTPLPWREGIAYHDIAGRWSQRMGEDGFLTHDGISGTTTLMLEAARFLDLPAEHRATFLNALMGWMLPSRDHSLFEIMRGAEISSGGRELRHSDYTPVDMYREVPGVDLHTIRAEIAPGGMFPHEARYLDRASDPHGFGETHPDAWDIARRIWPQLSSGHVNPNDHIVMKWMRDNGIDPYDTAAVRALGERVSIAHVLALTVYTRFGHHLIDGVIRYQMYTHGLLESAAQRQFTQHIESRINKHLSDVAAGKPAKYLAKDLQDVADGPLGRDWIRAEWRVNDAHQRFEDHRNAGHDAEALRAKAEERAAAKVRDAAWDRVRQRLAELDPRMYDEMRWHADMIHDALKQLPTVGTPERPVIAFRGDWVEPYYSKVYGSDLLPVVKAREFLSLSRDFDVAVEFMMGKPADKQWAMVVYKLTGQHAHDISMFSALPHEAEALFPPGTKTRRVPDPALADWVRNNLPADVRDRCEIIVMEEVPHA